MNENKCPHGVELIAKHEAALATLATTMNEFVKRYGEDRQECFQRYERDRVDSHEFRQEVRRRLSFIEEFIASLKPDHKMLMVLGTGIVIGALSLVWKMVWSHVTFYKGGG